MSDSNKLSRRAFMVGSGTTIAGASAVAALGLERALASKNTDWDLEGILLLGGIPRLLKEALYHYVNAEEITQIKDLERHRESRERAYQVVDFMCDKIKNAPGHAFIQTDIKKLISDFERTYEYPSPETVKAFFHDENMAEDKLERKTALLKNATNSALTDILQALERDITLSKKHKGNGR